jgi:hypothetical protein
LLSDTSAPRPFDASFGESRRVSGVPDREHASGNRMKRYIAARPISVMVTPKIA